MTSLPLILAGFTLRSIAPFADALEDTAELQLLLRRLGWSAVVTDDVAQALATAAGIGEVLDAAFAVLDRLRSHPTPDPIDVETLVTAAVDLLGKVQRLDSLQSAVTSPPFDQPAFWEALTEDLPAYLFCQQLEHDAPAVHALLLLVGVITYVDIRVADRMPFRKAAIDWTALGAVVINPGGALSNIYNWEHGVNHDLLLRRLDIALLSLGVRSRRTSITGVERARWPAPPPPEIQQLTVPLLDGVAADGSGYLELGVRLTAVPDGTSTSATGLDLVPFLGTATTLDLPLGGNLHLVLRGGLAVDGGVELLVFPGSARVTASTPDTHLDLEVRLESRAESPRVVIGDPQGLRLEVGTAWLSVGARGDLAAGAEVELVVQLGVGKEGLQLVLQVDPDDGLLGRLLGTQPQRVKAEAALTWSSRRGFMMSGNLGLTARLPLHGSVGPVSVNTVEVGLAGGEGTTRALAGVSGDVRLGPLTISVDRVGLSFDLRPTHGDVGNVGTADASFGFLPPRGVGISIDAPLIKGGGFLYLDPERSRYAGGLQLAFQQVSLAAIGLVTTRNADGSALRFPDRAPGYSLVVIIAATFPPVQIGLGFALTGVGGMIGYHRTVDPDALRNGLRSKALDAILFPADPAGHVDSIVSTLSSDFPVAVGRLVVGPMVRLTWGDPILATIDLAVLVELPDPIRIVLLGRLRIALPKDDAMAVVVINLDALGVLDMDRGALSLDATIHDSRIGAFILTGDMALRFSWKGNRRFLLSVGGWHPSFTAPPDFPALRRVTLALSGGDHLQLTVAAYFAITSNTVQFGGRVELKLSGAGAVAAGSVSLDTLITLNPFGMRIGFAAAVAISFEGVNLLAVTLNGTLTGPNPWHIQGDASFSLLMIEARVSFDASFGGIIASEAGPQPVSIIDLVSTEVAKPANWRATSSGADQLLRLRDSPAGQLRVTPLATLSFHQRVAPLGVAMARYGSAEITGPRLVTISQARVSGVTVTARPTVTDQFSPGSFLDLTDSQKLSSPSFVTVPAGVVLDPPVIDLDARGALQVADLTPTLEFVDPGGKKPTVASALRTVVDRSTTVDVRRGAVRLSPRPFSWERLAAIPLTRGQGETT